jgi:hypothetical protein
MTSRNCLTKLEVVFKNFGFEMAYELTQKIFGFKIQNYNKISLIYRHKKNQLFFFRKLQ